jgi:hypothetical protein
MEFRGETRPAGRVVASPNFDQTTPVRLCRYCALEIAQGTIVCPHCGRDRKTGRAPATPAQPVDPARPSYSWLLWRVFAVILVLAILIFFYVIVPVG